MTNRRRHITICREGVAYLVVMAVLITAGILREINLLVVLFGLMLGPLVLNWRSVAVALRGLEVRRRLPETLWAGDPLAVAIEVHNTRRRGGSWSVVVEDSVCRIAPDADKPLSAGVVFSHVPAGQLRRLSYQGRLAQRGRYRFGPLRMFTRFPLGLVRCSTRVTEPALLVVYPRLGRLTSQWAKRTQEAVEGSRHLERPQGLCEGDYHGLRDFRIGDSRRWIHWRTTARRGELMVKQFEQHRNHDLFVIVELWRPSRPGPEHRENEELAVSLAATIVSERCRHKASQIVVCVGGRAPATVRGTASPGVYRECMQRLALSSATNQDEMPRLLEVALNQIRAHTTLVLVSTRPTDLSDTKRFAAVWKDHRKRAWVDRAITIDASSPSLAEWFQMDAPAEGQTVGATMRSPDEASSGQVAASVNGRTAK